MIDRKRLSEAFQAASSVNGWSSEDRREIDASIRAAINGGDEQVLQLWLDWLRDISGLSFLSARCRAFDGQTQQEAELRRWA